MSGLFKPGQGDLYNTVNYLASKVGGTLNGTYSLPNVVSQNFSLPQYPGIIGVGPTQSQQDYSGLSNSILQKYFGGGYAAPMVGFGGAASPGGGSGSIYNPTSLTASDAGGTGGGGFPLLNGLPSYGGSVGGSGPIGNPNNTTATDIGQPWQGLGVTLPYSAIPGNSSPSQTSSMTPNFDLSGLGGFLGQLGSIGGITGASYSIAPPTGGVGGYTAPLPTGYSGSSQPSYTSPTSSPASQPSTDQSNPGTVFAVDPSTYSGYKGSGFNPIFAGMQPGQQLPGLGSVGLSNGVPGIPGASNITSLLSQFAGQNPGNFNPQIMSFLNNPGMSTLSQLMSGGSPVQNAIMNLAGTPSSATGTLSPFMQPSQNPGLSQLLSLVQGGGVQPPSSVGSAISALAGQNNVSAPTSVSQAISNLFSGATQDATAGAQAPLSNAQNIVSQIQNNPALSSLLGGNPADFSGVLSAFDTQRQQQLTEDSQNLREEMSNMGLRSSTNLDQAQSNLAAKSQANYDATVAQLIPTLTGQQSQAQEAGLGILSSLPGILQGIGSTSGSLGLGQQGNLISALTGAGGLGVNLGNLNLGSQSNVLQALTSAGNLGLGSGSLANTNLSNLLSGAGTAGGLSASDASRASQVAQTLASLGVTSTGQSGNLLSSLLGSQISAAGQGAQTGVSGANTLSSLFQGNQQNSLTALLQSPQVLSALNTLPYTLAGAQQGLASGDLSALTTPFNMNQTMVSQLNNMVSNAYNNYQQTQSFFPQLLGFLSGSQAPVTPSLFSQVVPAVNQTASTAGSIYGMLQLLPLLAGG